MADEVAHVVGGLFDWRYGVNHLQPENAFVVKHWATLPLLLNTPNLASVPADLPQGSAMIVIGHRTFYESGNDSARWLRQSRGMAAVIGGLLVVFIGAWGLRLWGDGGGVVSAVLAAFCPALLANGGIVMSDVAISLGLLGAVTAGWWMLTHPSPARAIICGVVSAFALLCKMSGVLIIPMFSVLLVARWLQARGQIAAARPKVFQVAMSCALVAITAFILVWAVYGFHFSMFDLGAPAPVYEVTWGTLALSHSPVVRLVTRLNDLRVLPEAWLYGLAHTLDHLGGRPAFLNGEIRQGGWWYFFPYACLVKTPLPLFVLMGMGALAVWKLPGEPDALVRRDRLWAATPLICLFGVYWLIALNSETNIGHRHLLPIYPPMLILAAGAVGWWRHPLRMARYLVVGLVVLFSLDSWLIRPDYLAYFNGLAGGPSAGHLHLVDSNLDVGQDLGRLSEWWRRHPISEETDKRLFLSYFGPADPVAQGLKAVRFGDQGFDARRRSQPAQIRGGWFCISVTLYRGLYTLTPGAWTQDRESLYQRLLALLQERSPSYAEAITFEHLQFGRLRQWLEGREPDQRVGYTLLLFRLTDAEVAAALSGPFAWTGPRLRQSPRRLPDTR